MEIFDIKIEQKNDKNKETIVRSKSKYRKNFALNLCQKINRKLFIHSKFNKINK